MVQINFGMKEISAKIVYYGPGMSGKTTNLEKVHELSPQQHKGNMTTIATEGDRTLFFDYMGLDLGTIAGMKTKLQLYTVPGQIYYNATRKLVLNGADGVIFIADSHPEKVKENIESLDNLATNLKENGLDIESMPLVIQYNKRDLPNALPTEEMDKTLKRYKNAEYTTGSARTGEGVLATLKKMAMLVLADLNKRYGQGKPTAAGAAASAPVATPPTAPSAVSAPAISPSPMKPVAMPPPPAIKPVTMQPSAPPPAAPKIAASLPVSKAQPEPPKEPEKKKGFFARLFGK